MTLEIIGSLRHKPAIQEVLRFDLIFAGFFGGTPEHTKATFSPAWAWLGFVCLRGGPHIPDRGRTMNPDSNIVDEATGFRRSSSALGLRRQDSLMRFMTSILEDPNEDDGSLAGEDQSHQQLGDSCGQPQMPSHLGLTGQVHNHHEPVAGMLGNHNQLGTSAPITNEPMQIDPQQQQQQQQQQRRSLAHHTERQDSGSSSSSTGEMLCTDISPDDFTKYLLNKSGNKARLPQQTKQNHHHQQEHQYTNNALTAAAAPATFDSSSQWSSHLPEIPQREGRISATAPTTTNWSSFGVHDTTDKKGGSNIRNCDPDNGSTARRSFSLDFTPKRPREEEARTRTKDADLGHALGDYYSELQASLAQTAAAVQREEDAYLQAAGLPLHELGDRPSEAAVDACSRANGITNNTSVEHLFHSSLPNLGAASPGITGTGGDQEDMFHNSLPNLGEQHWTVGVRGGEDRDAKRRRMLLQSSRKVVSERALGSEPMCNAPQRNMSFASTSSRNLMDNATTTIPLPQPTQQQATASNNNNNNNNNNNKNNENYAFAQGNSIYAGSAAAASSSSRFSTANIVSTNQMQIQANNNIINMGAAMQTQSLQQPTNFLQQTNNSTGNLNAFQTSTIAPTIPTALAFTTNLPPIQEDPESSQSTLGDNSTLTPEYITHLLHQPEVQRHQQELLQNFLQATCIPPPPVATVATFAPSPAPVQAPAGASTSTSTPSPAPSRHNPFAAGIPMVVGPNGILPLQQLYLQQDLRDELERTQQAQNLHEQRSITNTSPRGLPTPFTGQDVEISPGSLKKKSVSVAFDAIPLLTPTIPLSDSLNSSMKASQNSQQSIHDWDREMGLRRSHSKTMRASSRSRKKLQELQAIQDMFGLGNLVKKEERAKMA